MDRLLLVKTMGIYKIHVSYIIIFSSPWPFLDESYYWSNDLAGNQWTHCVSSSSICKACLHIFYILEAKQFPGSNIQSVSLTLTTRGVKDGLTLGFQTRELSRRELAVGDGTIFAIWAANIVTGWLQIWQFQYIFTRWWKLLVPCPDVDWILLCLNSVTKAECGELEEAEWTTAELNTIEHRRNPCVTLS